MSVFKLSHSPIAFKGHLPHDPLQIISNYLGTCHLECARVSNSWESFLSTINSVALSIFQYPEDCLKIYDVKQSFTFIAIELQKKEDGEGLLLKNLTDGTAESLRLFKVCLMFGIRPKLNDEHEIFLEMEAVILFVDMGIFPSDEYVQNHVEETEKMLFLLENGIHLEYATLRFIILENTQLLVFFRKKYPDLNQKAKTEEAFQIALLKKFAAPGSLKRDAEKWIERLFRQEKRFSIYFNEGLQALKRFERECPSLQELVDDLPLRHQESRAENSASRVRFRAKVLNRLKLLYQASAIGEREWLEPLLSMLEKLLPQQPVGKK